MIVLISTFCANIVGKIQSFDQGPIAENKDNYLYIRGEYKIYDHVNIARQARFEAHGPSQEQFLVFHSLRVNPGQPKSVFEIQIKAIAFLIFSSFKRKFELKDFNIACYFFSQCVSGRNSTNRAI